MSVHTCRVANDRDFDKDDRNSQQDTTFIIIATSIQIKYKRVQLIQLYATQTPH